MPYWRSDPSLNYSPTFKRYCMKRILFAVLLLSLMTIHADNASAQCNLTANLVSQGGGGCENDGCGNGCHTCAVWDIVSTCAFTDLTFSGATCFLVCTETGGWSKSKNTCDAVNSTLSTTGAGVVVLRIIICSSTSATFTVTSTCCGGSTVVNT